MRRISSTVVGASTNSRSAPASHASCARAIASSMPLTASASVRAMITKSGSSRASSAALILPSHSAGGTTALPVMWPQRFGNTWSSMKRPATPAFSYRRTAARDVGHVAEARVGVGEDRQRRRVAEARVHVGELGQGELRRVGPSEQRRGGAITAGRERIEPGDLRQATPSASWTPGQHEDLGRRDELFQSGGLAQPASSVGCGSRARAERAFSHSRQRRTRAARVKCAARHCRETPMTAELLPSIELETGPHPDRRRHLAARSRRRRQRLRPDRRRDAAAGVAADPLRLSACAGAAGDAQQRVPDARVVRPRRPGDITNRADVAGVRDSQAHIEALIAREKARGVDRAAHRPRRILAGRRDRALHGRAPRRAAGGHRGAVDLRRAAGPACGRRERRRIATCRSSWRTGRPIRWSASNGARPGGARWSRPATASNGTPTRCRTPSSGRRSRR